MMRMGLNLNRMRLNLNWWRYTLKRVRILKVAQRCYGLEKTIRLDC